MQGQGGGWECQPSEATLSFIDPVEGCLTSSASLPIEEGSKRECTASKWNCSQVMTATHRSSLMRSRSCSDGTKGGSGSLRPYARRQRNSVWKGRGERICKRDIQARFQLIVKEGKVAVHKIAALKKEQGRLVGC